MIKNVCVKLQERCNINKLKSIEDDRNMLFSNKLQSFGLTTRTTKADFVASRVINFQETSQFASRAWKKQTDRLLHGEYQYKTPRSKEQTKFLKPDVAQLNGLFCRLSRCSSKVGKGRRKLIFCPWIVKERSFPWAIYSSKLLDKRLLVSEYRTLARSDCLWKVSGIRIYKTALVADE